MLFDHDPASQVLQEILSELVLCVLARIKVNVEFIALGLGFIAGINVGKQSFHVTREDFLQLLEVHVVFLAAARDVFLLCVDAVLLCSILELVELLLDGTKFVIRDVSQNALLNSGLGGHDVCPGGKETLEILLSKDDV